PAAFAGIIYLLVRQKYFIGYLGQSSQSTPGYLFGKRIIFFLSLMCIVGIFNYLLWRFYGSDYKEYVETITSAASALLLLP
ncbi:Arachidonate 5-lipoxygenase-activating protein, partial [Characodon lateralis]|nr:Arachidonate 5-lipoxygenase-activating protein [Ataeniobius toweri]MED6295595.1 Arachidonate 5-lipoxygenase-activating protein [Characodon lateralis]